MIGERGEIRADFDGCVDMKKKRRKKKGLLLSLTCTMKLQGQMVSRPKPNINQFKKRCKDMVFIRCKNEGVCRSEGR